MVRFSRAVIVSGGSLVRPPESLALQAASVPGSRWAYDSAIASLKSRIAAWMDRDTGRRAAVICADRGFDHARLLGLTPDLIVGDLDSLSEGGVAEVNALGSILEVHPPAKDATDTELAVERALASGATRLLMVGALGGRVDHELANVMLLAELRRRRVHAEILDNLCRMLPLMAEDAAEKVVIQGSRGDMLTLIPLSSECRGVNLDGLEYPLIDATLGLGTSRGVSNVFARDEVTVSLERGLLLVIVTFADGSGAVLQTKTALSEVWSTCESE
jgi:thiamine pyrophosphokinase